MPVSSLRVCLAVSHSPRAQNICASSSLQDHCCWPLASDRTRNWWMACSEICTGGKGSHVNTRTPAQNDNILLCLVPDNALVQSGNKPLHEAMLTAPPLTTPPHNYHQLDTLKHISMNTNQNAVTVNLSSSWSLLLSKRIWNRRAISVLWHDKKKKKNYILPLHNNAACTGSIVLVLH